tara:strand:+ start:423 stop:1274 length:852 start_codon:yes stop_codon:yes gene_type:complete
MIDFVIFILTNGRPNNVHTARSLRNHGYTGKIILVIDDEDKTAEAYLDKFKDVEVFSKKEIAQEFDEADNFDDRRSIVYARNACFKIAEKLGVKYFIQMDDDYTRFEYRVYTNERQKPSFIENLDSVFSALLNFYKDSNFSTISMAQGGDFIGGKNNRMAKRPTLFRKCMNSFICSTDRPFKFVGRINEDVNTYVNKQSIGLLMGTIPFVSLVQNQTQSNKGGMTELYLDSGTYIKSFYTVMFSPSSVYIKPMGDKHLRLHHHVKWDSAVPKLISEKHKKTEE